MVRRSQILPPEADVNGLYLNNREFRNSSLHLFDKQQPSQPLDSLRSGATSEVTLA